MSVDNLPLELIELILSFVLPDRTVDAVALPASSLETRTLYACLYLSRRTLPFVQSLLYRHCLYIDKPIRLQQLARAYYVLSTTYDNARKRAASTSIYLAPFLNDTIRDLNVIDDLARLFRTLRGTLRRLVVDMPLRSAYLHEGDSSVDSDASYLTLPSEPHASEIRPPLREAFESLTKIEELTCVNDELYLASLPGREESEVWSAWHTLKRLALYNVNIGENFCSNLKRLPQLESIALTRPDIDEDSLQLLVSSFPSNVNLLFVNSRQDHQRLISQWRAEFPQRENSSGDKPSECASGRPHIRVLFIEDVVASATSDKNFNILQGCSDWVRDRAIDGSLWGNWGAPVAKVLEDTVDLT
jgi:hypothetical protein